MLVFFCSFNFEKCSRVPFFFSNNLPTETNAHIHNEHKRVFAFLSFEVQERGKKNDRHEQPVNIEEKNTEDIRALKKNVHTYIYIDMYIYKGCDKGDSGENEKEGKP